MARRRKEPRQDNLVRHPRVSPAPPCTSPFPLPPAHCPLPPLLRFPGYPYAGVRVQQPEVNWAHSLFIKVSFIGGYGGAGTWGGVAREGEGGLGDRVEGKFTHSAMPKWRLATSRFPSLDPGV